jgi:hypothetical protein
MDFAKFVDLLEARHLWFARLDKLPDTFEGSLPPASLSFSEAIRREIGFPDLSDDEACRRSKVWAKETYIYNQLTSYVNCWHMNEYESMAMWSIYSNRGVAVRSSFAQFCRCFDAAEKAVHVGEINYIDYQTHAIHPGSSINAALFKRKSFEHERELRAIVILLPSEPIIGTPDNEKYTKSQPPGIPIPVDLDTLIDTVYVSPGLPSWFRTLVGKVMSTYGLDKPVVASSLDERLDIL